MYATSMLRSLFLLVLPGVLTAADATPEVICLPEIAHYRYVGDMASDAQCTDDTIQHAIDFAPCPDTNIVITGEHTYTAQHLEIDGKNLALTGTTLGCGPPGACDGGCPPPPTSPVITISGSGHSGDSVLYIHGTSNVTLKLLTISDGTNFNGNNPTYGGGIHFDGQGSLTLDTTTIRDNQAMYGGGINFTGSSGFAGLALLGRVQILNNSAGASGGGIRIDGDSYMSVLYDNTIIWLNHAPAGYGGGINVVGPAHADIASPGFGSLGVIYSNDAKYGGGVAITASDGGAAHVNLYTTDPQHPVHVHDNFASSSGGAFYVKPLVSASGAFASLCANDFRIENNAAPEGSAIHADNDIGILNPDEGSWIFLNTNDCVPNLVQRCAAGVACNTISGNHSEDSVATPTLGAAIRIELHSTLDAFRFTMRGNEGGYAIRMDEYDFDAQQLSNCLLADNDITRQLIRTDSGALYINNCTITHNTVLSTDTIHAEGPLTLQNSIIDQPGNLALAYSANFSDLHVQYVLSSDVTTIFGEGVVQGAPTFANAANGDYHLQLSSKGVDYAPHIQFNPIDLDGAVRERDLLNVTNVFGYLDLGAYERQFACAGNDTVFCNGFEVE